MPRRRKAPRSRFRIFARSFSVRYHDFSPCRGIHAKTSVFFEKNIEDFFRQPRLFFPMVRSGPTVIFISYSFKGFSYSCKVVTRVSVGRVGMIPQREPHKRGSHGFVARILRYLILSRDFLRTRKIYSSVVDIGRQNFVGALTTDTV